MANVRYPITKIDPRIPQCLMAVVHRRASALREALIGLGVNADHVITQSLGERKPVATGQNESAYAQNRRGEFIVLRRK